MVVFFFWGGVLSVTHTALPITEYFLSTFSHDCLSNPRNLETFTFQPPKKLEPQGSKRDHLPPMGFS